MRGHPCEVVVPSCRFPAAGRCPGRPAAQPRSGSRRDLRRTAQAFRRCSRTPPRDSRPDRRDRRSRRTRSSNPRSSCPMYTWPGRPRNLHCKSRRNTGSVARRFRALRAGSGRSRSRPDQGYRHSAGRAGNDSHPQHRAGFAHPPGFCQIRRLPALRPPVRGQTGSARGGAIASPRTAGSAYRIGPAPQRAPFLQARYRPGAAHTRPYHAPANCTRAWDTNQSRLIRPLTRRNSLLTITVAGQAQVPKSPHQPEQQAGQLSPQLQEPPQLAPDPMHGPPQSLGWEHTPAPPGMPGVDGQQTRPSLQGCNVPVAHPHPM